MNDETLTFETALEELERIVSQLEAGDMTLDETIRLFERGQALSARCETTLNEAELRLEALQPTTGGSYDRISMTDETGDE